MIRRVERVTGWKRGQTLFLSKSMKLSSGLAISPVLR